MRGLFNVLWVRAVVVRVVIQRCARGVLPSYSSPFSSSNAQ
jgi:hypothetical protein